MGTEIKRDIKVASEIQKENNQSALATTDCYSFDKKNLHILNNKRGSYQNLSLHVQGTKSYLL